MPISKTSASPRHARGENAPFTAPSCRELVDAGGFDCPGCGRHHSVSLRHMHVARGAISALGEMLGICRASHPFILAAPATWEAAGAKVTDALKEVGVTPCATYIFTLPRPAPHAATVGEAMMFLPPEADCIIGVGGGVVNDVSKMLAAHMGRPYIYIPTAPSMDGIASATASMERAGLKVSIPAVAPTAILADTEILAAAPRGMILGGWGDMAAKYVSLSEWKLSHIINGEYYCPVIADMVRQALTKIEDSIEDALQGDADAVGTLTEGLILSGLSMACAGVSRPASGMEHYISHIRDMRGLAIGTSVHPHGIQCGGAALAVIRAYENLREMTPDRERALAAAAAFEYGEHARFLREFVGKGAAAMIDAEATEGKYDRVKHEARLESILTHWEELREEMYRLPDSAALEARMRKIGFPTLTEIGVTAAEEEKLFAAAPDIRDKYVQGRLLWDLGLSYKDVRGRRRKL